MKKVTIIYRTVPQYRVAFYNKLKDKLFEKNIQLDLIYGDNHFAGRGDAVDIEWAKFVKNSTLNIFGISLIWQPVNKLIKDSDLVIVEQANKLLINYLLILKSKFGNKKFAYWGHGLNLQLPRKNFFNKFKSLFLDTSDWWFTYTEGVKKFLIDNGVQEGKITVVQNAIDTLQLRKDYLEVDGINSLELRNRLGIKENEKVLIYCGGLSKEKNLPFLLKTAENLFSKGIKFKLLILGNGPEAELIKKEAQSKEYISYVGAKFGKEKALYFKISDIFLLPGAVGLAILDAFAFETPMITIEFQYHGPEIEYLENGKNGIICKPDVNLYSDNIIQLINNKKLLNSLRENGLNRLKDLNIDKMVENFSHGILDCLKR